MTSNPLAWVIYIQFSTGVPYKNHKLIYSQFRPAPFIQLDTGIDGKKHSLAKILQWEIWLPEL